jgi:hypothetical protein
MDHAGLFPASGQLTDYARDFIPAHAPAISRINFRWNWATNPDEVKSYPFFLDFLVKVRNLKAAIVNKGQNVANAKLISVTIAARRRQLKVVDGELVAQRGEIVVDIFKINGNTDLVRLRDDAGDTSYIIESSAYL